MSSEPKFSIHDVASAEDYDAAIERAAAAAAEPGDTVHVREAADDARVRAALTRAGKPAELFFVAFKSAFPPGAPVKVIGGSFSGRKGRMAGRTGQHHYTIVVDGHGPASIFVEDFSVSKRLPANESGETRGGILANHGSGGER